MRILIALLFTVAASAQMTYHDLEIVPDQSSVAGELRFIESTGWTAGTAVNYVGFKPPASIATNFVYTLPNALPVSVTRCIEITTGGVVQYAAGACGTSASAPFVDTTSIVEGSADATKEIRFEVDGLTTSTVRVLTPPNANIIVAGIDLAQTWTADQIFPNITVTSCTGCGGGSLPVVDTTSIVEGSSDASKELRFEVDGFTPSTIRVATPPNANFIMAGINLAQTWTATQTMQSIIPATHNFYTLGDAATYWDEISSIDFRAGFPSASSPLQGRVIFANTDLLADVAILSGGTKNSGAQFHATVQVDHFVVTSSFYINQDAGDLSCTNIANGRFVQATAGNELQVCEGAATFLVPYIAVSFAPLTADCTSQQVLRNIRVENGIVVEGTCAAN